MSNLTDTILINPSEETEKIVNELKKNVTSVLRKRGVVVGISGGIDSSVVLALCVRAFGRNKVLGLMLPEKESSKDNFTLARSLCNKFNVKYVIEDITGALEGFNCYQRRDNAIKTVFPEYDASYKTKIILPRNSDPKSLNLFHVLIISPEGDEKETRLPLKAYLEIVAASNFKQRARMNMLYFYAEARNYAVIGTGNKNEHEQGFFVKYGDGGADLKPVSHLFKTQIFQLAEYLEIPDAIRERIPTTDTYSAEQTQEEFFFKQPFHILDKIWLGWELGISPEEIAFELHMEPAKVVSVIDDIKKKIRATEYLRLNPY